LKVLFDLPLRQTVGLVVSLIELVGLYWSVPDYSTLCRRQARIAVRIRISAPASPLIFLIGSTATRFRDCGKWLARKDGATLRSKFHVAMHTVTRDIGAVEFTSSNVRNRSYLSAAMVPPGNLRLPHCLATRS